MNRTTLFLNILAYVSLGLFALGIISNIGYAWLAKHDAGTRLRIAAGRAPSARFALAWWAWAPAIFGAAWLLAGWLGAR